jgi:6-phosphogluconolactonase/glucosamine-6-phosphate isomerase/deaminase
MLPFGRNPDRWSVRTLIGSGYFFGPWEWIEEERHMKVLLVDDYKEMSRLAGCYFILEMMANKQRVNIFLPGGKTPFGMFEFLIPIVKDNPLFSHVYYFSMDEISSDTGFLSNMETMKEKYLTPAHVVQDHIVVLDENNYLNYEQIIADAGGIDAGFMGIGIDGHISGNIPPCKFGTSTRLVENNDLFIEMVSPMFEGKGTMSKYCVTVGIKDLLNTRRLYIVANGEHKAEVVLNAFYREPSEAWPASALQLHPDLVLILDKAAAKLAIQEGLL